MAVERRKDNKKRILSRKIKQSKASLKSPQIKEFYRPETVYQKMNKMHKKTLGVFVLSRRLMRGGI